MVSLSLNYTFYGAIVATVLALFVTTWYTCKRLFSERNYRQSLSQQGRPGTRWCSSSTSSADNPNQKNAAKPKDATDGDDEADDDGLDRLAHMEELQKLHEAQDPVSYCEHIQGEVKKVKQKLATKRIQESLTQEQIDEERKVQQEQLEAIFKLMQNQSEKFGFTSMEDVREQMSLYNV